MPKLSTLVTYIAVLTGFVFLPGLSILLTLARSLTSGMRVGIATSLGIVLGYFRAPGLPYRGAEP